MWMASHPIVKCRTQRGGKDRESDGEGYGEGDNNNQFSYHESLINVSNNRPEGGNVEPRREFSAVQTSQKGQQSRQQCLFNRNTR